MAQKPTTVNLISWMNGCLSIQPLREIPRSQRYGEAHWKMFYKQWPGFSCSYKISLKASPPTQLKALRLR